MAVLLVTADNGVTGREMVTNRQCGHRRGKWSRTGSGVTGGGNGHEQAVGSQGGEWSRIVGSQEGEIVTNRQWGHRRGEYSGALASHGQTVVQVLVNSKDGLC